MSDNTTIGYYITFHNKDTGKRELLTPRIFPTYDSAAKSLGFEPFDEIKIIDAYTSPYVVSREEADRRCRSDYYETVRYAAHGIIDDWYNREITDREDLLERISEMCDGHRQVIYLGNAIDTLRFSDNDSIGIEELGIDGFDFKSGIPWSQLAYWAFEADVKERIESLGLDLNEPKLACKGTCGDEFEPDDLDKEGLCEDCQPQDDDEVVEEKI